MPRLNRAHHSFRRGTETALLKRLHLIHPELDAGSACAALILMALTWVPSCLLFD